MYHRLSSATLEMVWHTTFTVVRLYPYLLRYVLLVEKRTFSLKWIVHFSYLISILSSLGYKRRLFELHFTQNTPPSSLLIFIYQMPHIDYRLQIPLFRQCNFTFNRWMICFRYFWRWSEQRRRLLLSNDVLQKLLFSMPIHFLDPLKFLFPFFLFFIKSKQPFLLYTALLEHQMTIKIIILSKVKHQSFKATSFCLIC
jgi:hypothetical protein